MRYFFDTEIDADLMPDETGCDLPTVDAARREARAGLSDLAREAVKLGGQSCTILVRTGPTTMVYTCSMGLTERNG